VLVVVPARLSAEAVSRARAAVVDSLAALVFFTAVAAATEFLVAGMSAVQVLVARWTMVPVLLLTGRPYGLWRDAILARTRGGPVLADTAAFLTFQVPLYAAVLWLTGMTAAQAIAAIVAATVAMTVLGRPYGIFLDRVRLLASRWSGPHPGGISAAMTGTPQTWLRRRR
jgi:hypothetical protein